MSKKEMVIYHLHTEYSNPQVIDSVTSMDDYIQKAKKMGMNTIGRTEHGNIYEWLKIKKKVEDAGLKYMHGAEFYVTETLDEKMRDNYHFVLYARNTKGKKELNDLMSIANNESHFYYKPRITLNELYNTSDNILVTTACLQNLLWKGRDKKDLVDTFLSWASNNRNRVFLEIQPHDVSDQRHYNKMLLKYSEQYNIRLIAGTDTHSLNKAHQEARMLIKYAKNSAYSNEDDCDLTFYNREKAEFMFDKQGVIPQDKYIKAIDNTIVFADMIDDYETSSDFKYPELYDHPTNKLKQMTKDGFYKYKKLGVIDESNKDEYLDRIKEELFVFDKLGMESFMAFMGELSQWCDDNNIQRGDGRGSVAGSTIAYLLDITDVDPVEHDTIFSRFCNEERVTLGDIDLDFSDRDRPKVFDYIIDRYGQERTAKVITFGTMATRGAIDEIGRGINNKHQINNDTSDMLYSYDKLDNIKNRIENDDSSVKQDFPEIFKYFSIIKGTILQVGLHAGGIVASPIKLSEYVGVSTVNDSNSDGRAYVTNCSKKVLEVNGYVKYDILGLRNIDILKSTYELTNKEYEKAHEIDWDDEDVWNEMLNHPAGIFQFTGDYAFQQLKEVDPKRIKDMSITNALLRPSGASIREDYYNDVHFENPSEEIDEMFSDQKGYVIFQEDTIAYLKDICGLTGGEADTLRRAIGAKDHKTVDKWLPKVKEGYRKSVNKPKEVAYKEVESFIEILSDSADYQFGYNHSTGYSMLGYRCARERYYHPLEFTTAFLRHADTEEQTQMGISLANYKNISINSITFGKSKGEYFMDKDNNAIYKGIASIKYLNTQVGDELFQLSQNNNYDSFISLLQGIDEISANSRQMKILIKLDYFREFGDSKTLFQLYKLYNNWHDRAQFHKENNKDDILKFIKLGISLKDIKDNCDETNKLYRDINFVKLLRIIEREMPQEDFTISQKIKFQQEYLGYVNFDGSDEYKNSQAICLKIDTKYSPKIYLMSLGNGNEYMAKVKQKKYKKLPINEFDVVDVMEINKKFGWTKDEDDNWVKDTSRTDWWIQMYDIIEYGKENNDE